MFNVAKFANGRAETRTHGRQSLKFLLFLICPIVASGCAWREREWGEGEREWGEGEREKE